MNPKIIYPTLTFEVGKELGNTEPKNYVERLLLKNTCKAVEGILLKQALSDQQKEDVHIFWAVCGHRIRDKIKDDSRLEFLLKKVLPRYSGPKIVLYRGENIERYKAQRIGFCWTKDQEVARVFARGLNSNPTGGVVLKYCFYPAQIISAPSKHSEYLDEYEYTIAPSTLCSNELTAEESYPPA